MPYQAPSIDDFNHARSLKQELYLGDQFDPFLDKLVEKIRIYGKKSKRKDVIKNIKNSLSTIIANVYRNYTIDNNIYTIIQLGNGKYKKSKYNPKNLNARMMQLANAYLCDKTSKYLEKKGGNYDKIKKKGYPTHIRAGVQLISELESFLFQDADFIKIDNTCLTRNTLYTNANSVELFKLFDFMSLPTIRLKGSKPKGGGSAPLQDFMPTDETKQMEAKIASINNYIQDHYIDLLMPDADFTELAATSDDESDEFGDERGRRHDMDLLFRKSLYRVFNNGTFSEGGRFYGGWWQSIPSEKRKYLTINGYPTAELDYSNMQIAMLYAKEGLALKGDAYSIEEIDPCYRGLIKRAVLKIINATEKYRHPPKSALPERWTFPEIVEAIETKHAPIAKYFATGIGLQLQRTDADIAQSVMIAMMKEDNLVLPVHDSFIVEDGKQERLREVMAEAFLAEIGQAIEIDAEGTLFQDLPDDDGLAKQFGFDSFYEYRLALDEEGVISLEDAINDIEERPDYVKYQKRKKAFLSTKSLDWISSSHFLI